MIALLVYAAIDIVLGVLPPHDSIISNAESDYGVGPYGWLMDVNFLLRGVLSVAAAAVLVRLRGAGGGDAGRLAGALLIALFGVCSGLLAFFPTSLEGQPVTPAGALHLLFAGIAFLAVTVGESVITPALRADARLSGRGVLLVVLDVAAWVFLLLEFLALRHAGHGGLGHLDGLFERLFLLAVLGWLFATAQGLIGTPAPGPERSA